jgi:ABC-type transporter Mla subunit MlaD
MAPSSVSKNNVIAGIFVIAGIVLAVAVSIMVSGAERWLARTHTYYVRFDLVQGTYGLKSGSIVTLAGQPVGRVTGVEFHRPAGPGSPPEAVDIEISLRADVQLFEDAMVFLERPLLGNLSSINIGSIGEGRVEQPQGGDPRLQPGEVLHGSLAPPAFLAQAGYGQEQIQQFRQMIGHASDAVDRINRLTERIVAEADPALAGIRAAVDDINVVTGEFREKTPQWTARVDTVLEQAERTATRLEPIADQVSSTIAHADAAIADLRQAIEANRPALDRIMANIDEAALRVNQESIDRLNSALASAQSGAEQIGEAGRSLNAMMQEQLPNVRRILANLRLAADQIKLAGTEVRRNPWRLLYQPGTRELESELFYDAARTYAEAVSDLRAASESLEAISRATIPETIDEQLAADLHRRLLESFAAYREAEQRLLDQMIRRR